MVICCDNVAAEHNVRAGKAKPFDHTCLVHAIWTHAMRQCIGIFVVRVPTKENCADDPSREDYLLMERMGAVKVYTCTDVIHALGAAFGIAQVKPLLHSLYYDAQSWDSLAMVLACSRPVP